MPIFSGEEYAEHAIAIGQAAMAWNWLHECLGHLFVYTFEADSWADRYWDIWNAANFDRPKRKLLEANVRSLPKDVMEKFPKAAEDLNWLLDRTEALEDDRNTVVHTPLFSMYRGLHHIETGEPVATVVPVVNFGNPRAMKLHTKDVLLEFNYVRDYAEALSGFANGLRAAIYQRRSWPNRPALPVRGPRKTLPN
jgi:hypothetical protein